MIFSEKKLIYLHLQKTGGNSISRALMPFSDDEIYLKKHQDGIDRFSVKGEHTTRKHATLAEYKDQLGAEFDAYHVALPVRDPFERAVSLYFSPHKWFVETDAGWEARPSYWDPDRFAAHAAKMQSLCHFLRLDGAVRLPDFVLRFDRMGADFDRLCQQFGFPVKSSDLPVANATSASRSELQVALGDGPAKALVKEIFAEDYEVLAELDRIFPR